MSTLSMLKFRASIFAAVLTLAPFSPASHAQDAGMRRPGERTVRDFKPLPSTYAPGVYTHSNGE